MIGFEVGLEQFQFRCIRGVVCMLIVVGVVAGVAAGNTVPAMMHPFLWQQGQYRGAITRLYDTCVYLCL